MISVFQVSSYVGRFAYKPLPHTLTLTTFDWLYSTRPLVSIQMSPSLRKYPEPFLLEEEALQMYSYLLTSVKAQRCCVNPHVHSI